LSEVVVVTWRRRKIKISGILDFGGEFVRKWLVRWGGFFGT